MFFELIFDFGDFFDFSEHACSDVADDRVVVYHFDVVVFFLFDLADHFDLRLNEFECLLSWWLWRLFNCLLCLIPIFKLYVLGVYFQRRVSHYQYKRLNILFL